MATRTRSGKANAAANSQPSTSPNSLENHFCQNASAFLPSALRNYYHNFGPVYTFFHFNLGPLMIMTFAPAAIMFLSYMNLTMPDASISAIPRFIEQNGGLASLARIIALKFIPNAFGLSVALGYLIFQILLMIVVPGPPCHGLPTATGHVPVYKDNGLACYIISMIALGALTLYMKMYTNVSPTIVLDRYDEILGALNTIAVLTCILLYFKGRYYPSTKDNGLTHYPLFDYYWGTELFPRVFGIDVKVLTNCRFGMTLWPLVVMLALLKNYELFGFRSAICVSTIAQMLYLTKFFHWESGYMKTMDIMVDRAGYYLCWGCLCYLPGLYTFPSRYFAVRPGLDMPPVLAIGLVALAFGCIIVQQLAEHEKSVARSSNGKTGLFGRKPDIIRAKYQLQDGKEMESILVASGFWGISRHFCYLPELVMTWAWSCSDGFASLLPYFYLLFLTILLMNRTYRDDRKCQHKYGKYWSEYMQRVPYRIVPYIW